MKLKELRKANNITQDVIAKELSVAKSTYSGYETGSSEPSLETLIKIADYYGVTLDYLCGHKTSVYNTFEFPPFTSDLDKDIVKQYFELPENKRAIVRGEIKALGLVDKK